MSVTVIPAEFTLSELMAYIEGEVQEVPDGHYTAQEWAEYFGVSVPRMRRILNKAAERNLLSIQHTMRVSLLTRRQYRTWVYAFAKEISACEGTEG